MINYGNYTATKSISVPYPIEFTLTARGNGSGTTLMYLNVGIPMTVTVTGDANIYTDVNGTLGESKSKNLSVGNYASGTHLYVKLPSGTAKVHFNSKQLKELNINTGSGIVNSPKFSGDFSNLTVLVYLIIGGISNFNSSISKLINIKYLALSTSTNEGSITGSISLLDKATTISLKNSSVDRIEGSIMYITGVVSNFTENPVFEFVDDENITFNITGDLTNIDPHLLYVNGFENCEGTIDSWTECYYIECDCPLIINTVAGMTKCGYFQVPNVILSTSVVNQLLADFRANVTTPKGYGPSEILRTFDLTGKIGSGAPSGQGLIDKQWLNEWVGSSGQRNTVTTR